MPEFISYMQSVIETVAKTNGATLFTAIGLTLFALGCFAAFKAISKPESITTLHKVAAYGGVVLGFVLTVSALSFSFLKENNGAFTSLERCLSGDVAAAVPVQSMTAEVLMNDLRTNQRVRWLVRLIGRKDKNDALSIGKIQRLGTDDQRFTFVADYDELKGMTASAAATALGIDTDETMAISAIIFPVGLNKIFPANARGLLQIISQLEEDASLQISSQFNVKSRLTVSEAAALLKQTRPIDWAFDSYKRYYPKYCMVVQQFRCASVKWAVAKYIGDITDDWHPLGFAKRQADSQETCDQTDTICGITDWQQAKTLIRDSFGVRVFLIQNLQIDAIEGRILLDFNNPTGQIIPFISQTIN